MLIRASASERVCARGVALSRPNLTGATSVDIGGGDTGLDCCAVLKMISDSPELYGSLASVFGGSNSVRICFGTASSYRYGIGVALSVTGGDIGMVGFGVVLAYQLYIPQTGN